MKMLALLVIIAALILIAVVFGAKAAKVVLVAIMFPISLAFTVLCFWLLFATQAPAATTRGPYFDGNTFFNTCSTPNAVEIAHCNAYALGISDAIGVWKKPSPETAPACPDAGVTGEQILDI